MSDEGHFKIVKVGDNIRSWDSQKGGPMLSYYVTVEGDERSFELAQKKETPPPVVGQELHARIESREHDGKTYYSLKKIFQGAGGKTFDRQPEHPVNAARMGRSHAQEMALRLLALEHPEGLGWLASHELREFVTRRADWFYEDVERAAAKVKAAPSQSPASGMKVEEGRGNGSAGASSASGASVPVSVPDPGQ